MSNDLIKRDDALAELEGKMTKTIEERRADVEKAYKNMKAALAAYAANPAAAYAAAARAAYAAAKAELAELERMK